MSLTDEFLFKVLAAYTCKSGDGLLYESTICERVD